MLVLYDFELSGDCYKARLLLTILGVPFERRLVDIHPANEHKTDNFLHLSPMGRVPVLLDDGLVLHDTQAILVYLARAYDETEKWFPIYPSTMGRMTTWFTFGGLLSRTIGVARRHDFFLAEGNVKDRRIEGRALLRTMEDELWFAELRGQKWLCSRDHPTIADIACFPHVMLSEDAALSLQSLPSLRRWTERFRRIPGFVEMPGIFPAAPLQ